MTDKYLPPDASAAELLNYYDERLQRGEVAVFTHTKNCGCRTQFALVPQRHDVTDCLYGHPRGLDHSLPIGKTEIH